MKKIFKPILTSLLQREAQMALSRHNPVVITIVGSVGKTTTKDAVAAALSSTAKVRKSQKSYNSDIGIPLAILGLRNPWANPLAWVKTLILGLRQVLKREFPEILVLEVGADRPGDISVLQKWLKSDVIVTTQFAKVPVHIENFPSRDAVLKEDLSILRTLKPGGRIVLNSDDKEFTRHFTETNRKAEIFTYGLTPPAFVLGSNEKFHVDKKDHVSGFSFKIQIESKVLPIEIDGVLGDQHAYPILAGFTTGIALGINPIYILEGLRNTDRQPARMRIIEGIKNTTIIDDSYNSSPIATKRALDVLQRIPVKGKRVAMLGDMLELGEHSHNEHRKSGIQAAKSADLLIAVGKFAFDTASGALAKGMPESAVLQFEDSRKAGKYTESLISDGDVILIKGSQGTRMERATLELMAHPEQKEELLARQEPEWEKR